MRTTTIDAEDRALAERLYRPLQRFAAVVAPVGVEGDDLVQEALVRVLRRRRLASIEHPTAYLKKTIVRLASNQRRSQAIGSRALDRWAASRRGEELDEYPSDLVDLMELTPDERAVLYLAEVEGFHFDEIARMLGCSPAAARKRASRGRKRLRAVVTTEAGR
jgi:RNA polymerase sigma-70 factor (ECF subfamily)